MHQSTAATRWLGTTALIATALLPACAYFRFGAPRPRWDMVAVASAALLLTAAWIWANHRAPKAGFRRTSVTGSGTGRDTPAVPRVLARPRRPWVFAAGSLVWVWALIALLMLAELPGGADQKVIDQARNAGAVVRTGTVESARHVVVTDDGTSIKYVTRHGRRYHRTTHHTPAWRADLVMRVPSPHGTETVEVEDAVVSHDPVRGTRFAVLYAPSRPTLGGVVNEKTALPPLLSSWAVPDAGLLVLTGIAVFLLLCVLLVISAIDNAGTGMAKMRADAAAGRVHACRVRIGPAVWQQHAGFKAWSVELKLPDRMLRLSGHGNLTSSGYRELLGVSSRYGGDDAWLCWPLGSGNHDSSTVAVLVLDDGQTVWGKIVIRQGGQPADRNFRLPGTNVETSPARTTRPLFPVVSRYRPSVHPWAVALLATAFLAVLPVLLAPLSSATTAGLCILSLFLTGAMCVRYLPRFAMSMETDGWISRPRDDHP
ncbi:hypothetical protein [Actinacidiphila glaucinigra]|uniref:hypothetical protein n=1 Tax=Actinacidiphila glaucinigra TaxID=235986 RepID=UPI003671298B